MVWVFVNVLLKETVLACPTSKTPQTSFRTKNTGSSKDDGERKTTDISLLGLFVNVNNVLALL